MSLELSYTAFINVNWLSIKLMRPQYVCILRPRLKLGQRLDKLSWLHVDVNSTFWDIFIEEIRNAYSTWIIYYLLIHFLCNMFVKLDFRNFQLLKLSSFNELDWKSIKFGIDDLFNEYHAKDGYSSQWDIYVYKHITGGFVLPYLGMSLIFCHKT